MIGHQNSIRVKCPMVKP